ncbi:MAG: FG-GAP-like repeat-containing protein [Flavobacterium sp.]|uniref:T9SS type A sorting domain-containing protein n=1 Tax=Flavobacterium celericrescens TaxID=2709780 RepID=A0ABX0IC48_9FLAO|nr:FG-GAP-like repeat-containing protein [Flavobacterium celericrescens]NHM04642.1 T9SS type A sorting domain-containing protein [Flavobacterium celericrescens]
MKKITLIIALSLIGHFAKAQDTCASASPITTAGLYIVSAVNGTQVPSPICADNGAITNGTPAGEWYAYTPSSNYTVTITTDIVQNTPKVDTRFHVYTGTCASLTCYSGDDDTGANYSSVATFNVTANTTYIIAWDNKWTSSGFTFQLIEAPIVIPPPTPITYTTQTVSTVNSTYNICVADMNGDGKDDIAGVSANNLRIHYQGTTPGTFSVSDFPITGTSMMPTWSMAAGDTNKDGFNDLVLGNGSGLSVWRSNSTGTAYSNFTPGQYIFCQRTNFADLNNDGNLDVFSCHDIAPNCYYLNDGANNLTFYQSTVTPGAMTFGTIGGNYATLFTDFDNDGDSDVFVSKCSGPPCELHRNDGAGVYTDISAIAQINVTPIQTWSSAIADFDNDGDMDIIITASAGLHKYFRNNLDTTNSTEEAFTNITAGSGWDTNTSTNIDNVAYDFDNDGYVDVLAGGNKIMFNQGNSTFLPVSYSGISVGAIGDLNNDGFLDILNGSTIRYAIPNANNWIKVLLKGIQSNSNGIGARVEIYGPWGKQIRDIRSGEGFKYMSSLNAHFGIGTATSITQVVIIWPSGTVDVINNPSANQSLTVIEGSSPLSLVDNGDASIILYPNPAADMLSISNIESLMVKKVSIISTLGKVIKTVSLNNNSFSIADLAEGLYILTIETEDGKKYSESFIKKN